MASSGGSACSRLRLRTASMPAFLATMISQAAALRGGPFFGQRFSPKFPS
jgi:hypothetical protein